MLFALTSIQEFFFGFCIIFVSKPVNVTWDDESAFNQKFGTLSIPRYFNFWDLVNAAFSSSTVIFSYSCTFTFSFSFSIFPIQLADILQASFSRYIPFQNFSILSLGGVSFTITWFFSVSLYNFSLFRYKKLPSPNAGSI